MILSRFLMIYLVMDNRSYHRNWLIFTDVLESFVVVQLL